MDLFKFNQVPGRQATVLERGEIIQGITSVLWVERYRGAGEFTIVAPISSGLKDSLPIGSFISHVDTYEVMIVENHEISETDDETNITISGRSFVTILERRTVGENLIYSLPSSEPLPEYVLSLGQPWLHAVNLIRDHVQFDAFGIFPENVLENVGTSAVNVGAGTLTEGPVKQGNVYDALIEILAIDDLGVKTVRPGSWSLVHEPPFIGEAYTDLRVYLGYDRSNKVIFSYDLGDIESSEYLWSNKNNYTNAHVRSKWVYVDVGDPLLEGSERRTMYVDASFIDTNYAEPLGVDYATVLDLVQTYGEKILAAQRDVALVKVEVSKERTRFGYRKDYSLGDIVRVEGNYDTTRLAKVVEYAEIEDETGESGYPTLSLI